ncbi:MAG: polynucleotide kinase-phosphatase [Anaerolineaceae bacterium]|nr:polynucleotide kinase-phosphatase [Anaerolineaceae bacterium]
MVDTHASLTIPEFALVVLIGVSGSGKSTFARRHFGPFETISSDFCRGLVSDDENNQAVSGDAFDLLHAIVAKRLHNMKLTVVDATNVQPESRKKLVALAREYHALPVAIVLDLPERLAFERNQARPDRTFGIHVIKRQRGDLKRSLRHLKREGFNRLYQLRSEEEIAAVEIVREPLWNDKRSEHGPFDIIGDVHGCYDELVLLLGELGYQIEGESVTPPEGRKAIFLGDLVDRGPKIPQVLRLVMGMVAAGTAICIPGNHDVKLKRALDGKNVRITHGLGESLVQLEAETTEFREQVRQFIDGLVSHYVLDDGRLVVAHAGMREDMAGRASGKVREFALYGETTGETDEFGLPVRYNWAADYRGQAMVVYGHTPVPEPEWLNRTINIDTGCVFGGALTALRYPENEIVSVDALQTYAESVRPFLPEEKEAEALSAQQQDDGLLDIGDVTGKRLISTRLRPNITIREENATAALEVMSRFAINPKWLITLPPTMSPSETSSLEGYLEHPAEAFAYYRSNGVPQVICEQKHMGSRTLVVICQDEDAARQRFGVIDEGIGVVYTRSGRRFFNDLVLEAQFMTHIRDAISAAGLWETLNTSWMLLDCELMPWSAKAQGLLQDQYAAVGAAANASLGGAVALMQQAAANGADIVRLLNKVQTRQGQVAQYVDAYRAYCWPVESLEDLKLAPFHLLATEGVVHVDKDHSWHMDILAQIAQPDEALLMRTEHRTVDVTDADSQAEAIAWWQNMTERGGEGMVVKPLDFLASGSRGLLQPAVKVRGREYLRIIYGPEYTDHLDVLRKRGLNRKRSLALREFALGIEALERFVRHEPLRRVHECVFGVMALESEPVDPRL